MHAEGFGPDGPSAEPPTGPQLRDGDVAGAGPDGLAGLGEDLARTIERLAAETRVDDAAAARRRRGRLVLQATEDATFAGVITDLAEHGRPVAVHTTSGRAHRGRLRATGTDCLVLDTDAGEQLLVRHSAIASVRAATGPDVAGDRGPAEAITFQDVLRSLGASRARVLFVTRPPAEAVAGELRWVGRDVATVRLDAGTTAYVPIDGVHEVLWRDGA